MPALLVAALNSERIEAYIATRGDIFHCPGCLSEVTLKRGRQVVAHFAHKPLIRCEWGKGETPAHRNAKAQIAKVFRDRGLRAEVEFEVATLAGDRRADVMTWHPKGRAVAIELQHTNIDLDNIERRAKSYAGAGIAQLWVPFLSAKAFERAMSRGGRYFVVERYSPRPFELWVSGFHGDGQFWMYDPKGGAYWRCRLSPHYLWVPESSYYDSDGSENIGGGYHKESMRFRELSLSGPYRPEDLRISIKSRNAESAYPYFWPTATLATFV